uniref:WecB/TagA/CpsF family glycosyltransferase n=1 Tax=candidate division WWE3 bacterium TaxID=2053526 RepID=A0A7C4Y2F6_UNCKA
MTNNWRKKEILGVSVDFGLNKSAFLGLVKKAVDDKLGAYVCTVNPEFIMSAQSDIEFRTALNESYLNVPDGSGVLMADKYLSLVEKYDSDSILSGFLTKSTAGLKIGLGSLFNKNTLDPKISGSDIIYDICDLAQKSSYTVLFLGGWKKDVLGRPLSKSPNIAKQAAAVLMQKLPNLKVVFASSEIDSSLDQDEKSLNLIKQAMEEKNLSHIDIVFAAFGHRKQELWLRRNLQKIPASFGIGVGGAFDFVSGHVKRAPIFMTMLHLEWLYRLIRNPWRVKRILTAFPIFPLRVFIQSIKGR